MTGGRQSFIAAIILPIDGALDQIGSIPKRFSAPIAKRSRSRQVHAREVKRICSVSRHHAEPACKLVLRRFKMRPGRQVMLRTLAGATLENDNG
jgi:hypothetical protein